MDTLIGVAVTMHIMSAVIAFVAANYTYRYMRRSEAFFVVKERIPTCNSV